MVSSETEIKYGQMQIRIANEIRKVKYRTSHTLTVPEVIEILESVRDPEGLG